MCKLCKKLREIIDSNEKEYFEIIRSWKSHAYNMEKLLKRIDDDLLVHFEYMALFFPGEEKILQKSYEYMALFFPGEEKILQKSYKYRHDIKKLITKPWIGK